MRYYDITITDATSGAIVRPASLSSLNLPTTITSLVNGRSIPGALEIELNIPFYNYQTPLQGAFVRVWGLSLAEIGQGTNLSNADIIVRAGMAAGLPLANPAQAGVIIQGKIFQVLGNWSGTDMTLDLILLVPSGLASTPAKNFSFNWPANTPLSSAIQATLRTAMPGFVVQIAINPNLKMSSTQSGIYSDLAAFSHMIADLTQAPAFQGKAFAATSGAPYAGVDITVKQKTIIVVDGTQSITGGTTPNNPKKILFQDLIGQPTWFSPTEINFRTVLRADISVNDYVLMPDQLAVPFILSTGNSTIPGKTARNTASFNGVFRVSQGIHFGKFRQPTGDAWTTSFNAVYNSPNPMSLISGASP